MSASTRPLQKLEKAADTTGVTLYQANMRTYQLLRKVLLRAGGEHEDVHLIDWDHPERNDFALAEEVTLKGGYQRRPDLVVYINGLAIAVIELKRSSVDIGDGVPKASSTTSARPSSASNSPIRASTGRCPSCWMI
jgi:type I restriction enzyme R subunit